MKLKPYALTLMAIFAHATCLAQNTQGVITYNVKMNMYRMMTAAQEAYKSMIPEFSTHREQLFFNSIESCYMPLKDDGVQSGGGMTITSNTPWDETYHNFTSRQAVSAVPLGGDKYNIKEEF